MQGMRRWAGVLVTALWILIGAGSLVTTTGSGLSIPDWPLAYHRLVPPYWQGGVIMEYSHRVLAGVVLLLAAGLAVAAHRRGGDPWSRRWPWVILGLLLAQAALGGVTVLLDLPKSVSILHAAVAQLAFLAAVALAVHLHPPPSTGTPDPETRRFLRPWFPWVAGLALLLYLQVLAGALVRHHAAGLAVPDFPLAYGRLWPPREIMRVAYLAPKIRLHMIHRYAGIILGLGVLGAAVLFHRRHPVTPAVRTPARWAAALVLVQIPAGGWIIWSSRHWFPTTLHVLLGTALVGVVLWWAMRLYGIEHQPGRSP